MPSSRARPNVSKQCHWDLNLTWGVADEVARQLHSRIGMDARVTVLGHTQRGGSPGTVDKVLATAFGVHAVELASQRKLGRVVTWHQGRVGDVSYGDIVEGTRSISPKDQFLHAAEAIGICMGRSAECTQKLRARANAQTRSRQPVRSNNLSFVNLFSVRPARRPGMLSLFYGASQSSF